MFWSIFVLSLLTLLASPNSVLALEDSEITQRCHEGVYIIVARGTYEPQHGRPGYGEGGQYSIAQEVKRRIPKSEAMAVTYPATISNKTPYFKSESEGVGNMTRMIKRYVDKCPRRHVVLMGYSQGAQVVADVLCGSVFDSGPYASPPIGDVYAEAIAAVILMGDPSHVAGQPWDANNTRAAHTNGLIPRTRLKPCSRFYGRAISYCDKGDAFCQTHRPIKPNVHGSYVKKFGNISADFIVRKAREHKENLR